MLKFNRPSFAGMLPFFADERDPRPIREQFNQAYAHGGGWHDFEGFVLVRADSGFELHYPGDRPMRELTRAPFRDQTVILFEYDWVAVLESDGLTFAVSRMD